jgi:hypothetical protein
MQCAQHCNTWVIKVKYPKSLCNCLSTSNLVSFLKQSLLLLLAKPKSLKISVKLLPSRFLNCSHLRPVGGSLSSPNIYIVKRSEIIGLVALSLDQNNNFLSYGFKLCALNMCIAHTVPEQRSRLILKVLYFHFIYSYIKE